MTEITKPRVAVSLRPEYDRYSLDRLADYSKVAETRGFDSIWIAESWGLDAISLLSHVGSHTKKIGLGTSIINVFSRTPSLLAMTAITMNDLYGGRFILGLGASTKALVEGFHGLSFDKPITRLRDAVNIIRQAATGNEIYYDGKTVAVNGYRIRVEPRNPPAPIYLAALSPESIKLVGQMGDGWLPYLLPKRGLKDAMVTIRQEAGAAGRSAQDICIAPVVMTAVSEDADAARDAARNHLAFYLGAMGPHYRSFVARHGFESEVEAVRENWARKEHEAARKAVTDEMLDEIAVTGTPAECREKVAALHADGVDLPILFFPGTCTNEMVELAIETMAEVPVAKART